MAELAAEIERARQREFDAREAAIFSQISVSLAFENPGLDQSTGFFLAPFVEWCGANGARHCPAKPATVAGFIVSQANADQAQLIAMVEAIEALHDHYGLANPMATAIARRALDCVTKIASPRSWPKQDKVSFARLPIDIQAIIAKREVDREKQMRRAQNEVAELRQMSGAETKPPIQNEAHNGEA